MFKLIKTFTIILFSLICFESRGQNVDLDSVTKVLEEVFRTDQEPRIALDSIARKYGNASEEVRKHWKKIHMSDSINLSTVTSIIEKYGWLSAKETSKNANAVLFLVIQHSDLTTQLKYLPYLKAAVKNGKASAEDEAYLEDRIRSSQGMFQIYGTQFQSNTNGKMFLYPIEDEPNVNKRRRKVGLDSLEIFAKKMDLEYSVPKNDRYKNKIVIYGILADEKQKPLPDAEVFLGDTQLLGKTDKDGSYTVVVNKRDEKKGLTFRKHGYRTTTFKLDQGKQVYIFMYLLSHEESMHK